ncbi:unnamed protein product [Parajaminaea phylloscopi]
MPAPTIDTLQPSVSPSSGSSSTATVVPLTLHPSASWTSDQPSQPPPLYSLRRTTEMTQTRRPGTADSGYSYAEGDEDDGLYEEYVYADAVTDAAHRAEVARQEQLALQQDHERWRLRRRLAEERQREAHRQEQAHADSAARNGARAVSAGQPHREQHPVYLLNCKGCGSFLSDRGMRAVLLLKPQITLYSTDVMPDNCGPLYPSTCPSSIVASSETPVERTCDCLTQTLGCYGCGAQVGYHIASPCIKCTASVNELKRGSNGHRTVLHCSEITVRQRRYVPGEAGVLVSQPPTPPSVALRSHHLGANAAHHSSLNATSRTMSRHLRQRNSALRYHHMSQVRSTSNSDRLRSLALRSRAPWHDGVYAEAADKSDSQPCTDFDQSLQPPKPQPTTYDGSEPRVIERGAIVYWSDLRPGGERTRPFDPDVALSMPIAGR